VRRTRVTALLAAAVLAVAGPALAGCSHLASEGGSGYITGGGYTELPPAKRKVPGDVQGRTLEGRPISLDDYRGKVVVINVWGSWCGDCRAETATLNAAAAALAAKDVAFLGINTRDNSAETALAYQQSKHVPYPSIFDPGGRNLLAFHGTLTPNAIPSTVIIDAQGRVAASYLGTLPTKQTLVDMVEDVAR
jgi:thiol-disulfide isomerase/thioredoxin